jgi:hypothetical protein
MVKEIKELPPKVRVEMIANIMNDRGQELGLLNLGCLINGRNLGALFIFSGSPQGSEYWRSYNDLWNSNK